MPNSIALNSVTACSACTTFLVGAVLTIAMLGCSGSSRKASPGGNGGTPDAGTPSGSGDASTLVDAPVGGPTAGQSGSGGIPGSGGNSATSPDLGGNAADSGVAGAGGAGGSGGSGTGGIGTGGSRAGGTGAGVAGAGGIGGGGSGGVEAGGRSGLSGSGGYCYCPATQCSASALTFSVYGLGGSSGTNAVLGSITAQGSSFNLQCQRSGCSFYCMSKQSRLADGTYSATITVPGYHAQTVSVQVVNPTDCGCCTCCPFFTNTQVSLEPDGTPITGCCSDLVTDPNNCGVCGKKCATDAWCASGACTPVYSPCVRSSDGFSTCSDYCKKQGTTCKSACGPSGGEAIHWWGQGSVNCGDNIYSSHGTCDDPLTMYTGVRCCCS